MDGWAIVEITERDRDYNERNKSFTFSAAFPLHLIETTTTHPFHQTENVASQICSINIMDYVLTSSMI